MVMTITQLVLRVKKIKIWNLVQVMPKNKATFSLSLVQIGQVSPD